jgi:hypothetical protein
VEGKENLQGFDGGLKLIVSILHTLVGTWGGGERETEKRETEKRER